MAHPFQLEFIYLLLTGLIAGYLGAWITYRRLIRAPQTAASTSDHLLTWPALGFILPGLFWFWEGIAKGRGIGAINLNITLLCVFSLPFSALLGVLDDRFGLSGKSKLVFFMIGFILFAIPSYSRYGLGLMAAYEPVAFRLYYLYLCFPALLIFLALPLLDGVDGLFTGFFASAGFFYAALYPAGFFEYGSDLIHDGYSAPLMLVCGLLLGFLPFNFRRPKLRLSEGLVLPLTILLGSMALDNSIRNGISRWTPAHASWLRLVHWSYLPFLWPICDLFLLSFVRFRKGRSVFRGGHDHLHHRLLQSGLTAKQTVVALIAANGWFLSSFVAVYAWLMKRGMEVSYGLMEVDELGHLEAIRRNARAMNVLAITGILVLGLLPLAYLFWRGYTKVDPYKSGAVDERGRP